MRLEWNDKEVIMEVNKALEKAAKRGAEITASQARQRCPVGSFERDAKSWKRRSPGSLRDSIGVVKSRYKNGGYLVVAGDFYTYYAKWVELGAPARSGEKWKTAGHAYPVPRQPFMRPAAMATGGQVKELFKAELKKSL